MNVTPLMAEPDLWAAADLGRAGAESADATDATARLWRAAEPILRRELPATWMVDDVRRILHAHGLIANDGTEELRCLGTWPRKLGARKLGSGPSKMRSIHGTTRAIWTLTPPEDGR